MKRLEFIRLIALSAPMVLLASQTNAQPGHRPQGKPGGDHPSYQVSVKHPGGQKVNIQLEFYDDIGKVLNKVDSAFKSKNLPTGNNPKLFRNNKQITVLGGQENTQYIGAELTLTYDK
jgi:hypothetical protein